MLVRVGCRIVIPRDYCIGQRRLNTVDSIRLKRLRRHRGFMIEMDSSKNNGF